MNLSKDKHEPPNLDGTMESQIPAMLQLAPGEVSDDLRTLLPTG